MQFIFLFTTGRTGTGFLSQCFGGSNYEKNKIHYVNDSKALVTHESWKHLPIPALKQCFELSNDLSTDIVYEYLNDKILETKSKYPCAEKYFVTDHKVGRFFAPSMCNLNFDYKVIRVLRDHEDVAMSFLKRIEKRKEVSKLHEFSKFYERIWSHSFYNHNDSFVINNVSELSWNAMTELDKLKWYSAEVERQWLNLKVNVPEERFIEVTFNEIINNVGLSKISNFIDLDYCVELSNLKANS